MPPTENGAAAATNPGDGTTPESPLLHISSLVSEDADKMDPLGENLSGSSEKPDDNLSKDEKENAKIDKKENAKIGNSSEDKLLELMVRLDPSGFLFLLCLLSIVYALVLSWRFWRLLDQPTDQFWSISLLLWLLLFVWTISLSDSTKMVMSKFSYMLLLSCAVTHFVGPMNGMLVMYIGTLYAAGLLGYTALGYSQRLGFGKSAVALVSSKVKVQKHNEVGASLLCSLISVCSLVCLARIAWLVLAPDMTNRSFFKSFDYVVEMSGEIWCNFGMWTVYITQFDLGGAILSIDQFVWAAPSFLCGGLLIAISIFLAMGDAAAVFFLWIVTMALLALFGYALALRAFYKATMASFHQGTKWAQRSDKVYLMIELVGAKDLMLNLKPDGHFNFLAKDPDEIQYELHLELFGAIDVEESKVAVAPGIICYLIKKAESNWWPRLLKNDGKTPVFLKVDSDKLQHEDDKDTGSDDFGDMVFVKLGKESDHHDTVIGSPKNGVEEQGSNEKLKQ